jgi:hypothetical protein
MVGRLLNNITVAHIYSRNIIRNIVKESINWRVKKTSVVVECILILLCILIMNATLFSRVCWTGLKDFAIVIYMLLYSGPILQTRFPDSCETTSVLLAPHPRKLVRSIGKPSASGTSGCYYSTPRCLSYTDSGLSAYPGDPLVGTQNPIRGHDPG